MKSKNNGKKEFAKSGLEVDCTSTFGKRYLCYVNNIKGIRKFVKRSMNKRFRKANKNNEVSSYI